MGAVSFCCEACRSRIGPSPRARRPIGASAPISAVPARRMRRGICLATSTTSAASSAANPNIRSYATSERQNFHIDRSDVVALLCLRRAKSGGLSAIVSSMTVHNVMAARRPDLLERLYQPFPVDRRGEVPEGKAPFYEAPVFNEHAGYLSVLYSRLHIGSSQRFPEARRLTAEDVEALDMFAELAGDPELRLDMSFMPGDIQFLHNHTILHAAHGLRGLARGRAQAPPFAPVACSAGRSAAAAGLRRMLWRRRLSATAAGSSARAPACTRRSCRGEPLLSAFADLQKGTAIGEEIGGDG